MDRRMANGSPWFAAGKGIEIFGSRTNYQVWFDRAVTARIRREQGK
jgi:hypothetical protein